MCAAVRWPRSRGRRTCCRRSMTGIRPANPMIMSCFGGLPGETQMRWKDGSRGMLTVCGLFAGFTGVILVNLIIHAFGSSTAQPPPSAWLYVSIGLAAFALWLFALSAERITDALDENRVKVY